MSCHGDLEVTLTAAFRFRMAVYIAFVRPGVAITERLEKKMMLTNRSPSILRWRGWIVQVNLPICTENRSDTHMYTRCTSPLYSATTRALQDLVSSLECISDRYAPYPLETSSSKYVPIYIICPGPIARFLRAPMVALNDPPPWTNLTRFG